MGAPFHIPDVKSNVFATLVVADMWLHMHLSGCKHAFIERCESFLQTLCVRISYKSENASSPNCQSALVS